MDHYMLLCIFMCDEQVLSHIKQNFIHQHLQKNRRVFSKCTWDKIPQNSSTSSSYKTKCTDVLNMIRSEQIKAISKIETMNKRIDALYECDEDWSDKYQFSFDLLVIFGLGQRVVLFEIIPIFYGIGQSCIIFITPNFLFIQQDNEMCPLYKMKSWNL